MSNYELPQEDDQIFVGKKDYSPTIQTHLNDFTAKLRLARTLGALTSIKQDILRSDLISNFSAIGELKAVANQCAKELDHKIHEPWWA